MNAISPITFDRLRETCPSVFAPHAHASRSSKYTFIPTIDSVQALIDEGYQLTDARQSRTRLEGNRNFTKHMLRFRAPDLGSDEFRPEAILTNSHNGNGAYKIMGGGWRAACFNGLIVATTRVEAVIINHRGKVIDEMKAGIARVLENSRTVCAAIEHWQDIGMSDERQREFAEQAYLLRWPLVDGKRQGPAIGLQLNEPRRETDCGNDLWRVFNRVQENLTQGGQEYVQVTQTDAGSVARNLRTRPIRGIDETVKINQQLWDLAENCAG